MINSTNSTIAPGIQDIQDITYTYDAVGNITQITDTSNTHENGTSPHLDVLVPNL